MLTKDTKQKEINYQFEKIWNNVFGEVKSSIGLPNSRFISKGDKEIVEDNFNKLIALIIAKQEIKQKEAVEGLMKVKLLEKASAKLKEDIQTELDFYETHNRRENFNKEGIYPSGNLAKTLQMYLDLAFEELEEEFKQELKKHFEGVEPFFDEKRSRKNEVKR